jgi:hypothetical protein
MLCEDPGNPWDIVVELGSGKEVDALGGIPAAGSDCIFCTCPDSTGLAIVIGRTDCASGCALSP